MMYLELFWNFFKTGLFTIGGGLASLPLLKEAFVDGGYLSPGEFIDMIAVSQSTPGPIGINMSTFIGYRLAGVFGGIVTTAGIVAPSLIIIMLIASLMKNFASLPGVKNTLEGIRPAALGLIASAVWFILDSSVLNFTDKNTDMEPVSLLVFAVFLIVYRLRPACPVIYIAAGGIVGLLFL